ncbi:hypothetical protein [Labedaea rhizosphaerae]|uniref:Uncharacterized protein n=1 Tax=Labedaea rhizosphaerae TaxID=598644 RepID=A0A4R6S2R3_LABRH|nr:hypothetical protein [Labedaea rhizosphaerae]TDP93851.1 hypothetical protein EV186_106245 [Labedaea rhizosphaerae]
MFGIDKALRKLKKAVDHLTKPIPPLHEAVQAAEHLAGALAKRYNDYLNGERTGIKPLRGGTNWDAYHHSELYAFVHVDASPQQVLEQVEAWFAHADGLRSKGDAVGR